MKRLVTIAFALAFAPILIDQATMDQILQAAHQNMRGTEYDWTVSLFKQLEQNAQQSEAAKEKADAPHPEKIEPKK